MAIASRSIACLRSAVEVGSLGREDDDDASGDVGGDSESDSSGGTAAGVRFAAVDALAPRRVRARVVRFGERGAAFERWVETHGMGAEGGESSGSRRKGRFSVGFHERKRPCRTPPTRTRADAARGRDALRVSGNASRVASRGERVESAPRPRRKRGAMWRCGDVETTPRRGICRDRKVVHAPTTRIRSSGCRVPVFPARVPGRGPPSACVGALGSRAGARRRRRSRSPRTVRLPIPS